MFQQPLSDPTAGESARLKRLHPEVPQPIFDPTDPRSGSAPLPREVERAEKEDRPTPAGRRL